MKGRKKLRTQIFSIIPTNFLSDYLVFGFVKKWITLYFYNLVLVWLLSCIWKFDKWILIGHKSTMPLRLIEFLFLPLLHYLYFILALHLFVKLKLSLLSNLWAKTFVLVSVDFLYAKRGTKFHNVAFLEIFVVLLYY